MRWSPVVELRQYTLVSGKRDVLVDLFEAQFIESQESCGIKIIGTFRDADDPNKFVWLRGFPSMDDRARSLSEFYGGSAWKRHRDAANATMMDSDDVLLLRPARVDSGFALWPQRPSSETAIRPDRGIVEGTVLSLAAPAHDELLERLERDLATLVENKGSTLLACFVTCEAENNFPVLPVREGEHVVVWFEGFPGRASYDASKAQAAEVRPSLSWARFADASSVLRLQPTRRSLLTGSDVSMAINEVS